jgi:hypothetical protein
MKRIYTALIFLLPLTLDVMAQPKYLGNLNTNSLDKNSVNNSLGQYGSSLSPDSVNNPIGQYGSSLSNRSVSNPLATEAPKLYDQNGNYRGKLSSNRLDPESVSNPCGRYGNPLSPNSIHNPLGAGSALSNDVISIYDGSDESIDYND